ncbi:hypothetical protein Xentx_00689 [Xenorhabdus thuongxuanensis]|uniref:Uncharacterized protein n=1 Tax=Xenorhabdus thuongxuanensis TaxID=1873484 RepID=A0A1Q5U7M0_9GAMM|nr:hypothetical protein Xentx_00689 [Xenorhabdus thuongxuanensis]
MTAYRAEFFTLEDVKRLKLVQDKHDNNRSQSIPVGNGSSRKRKKPTEKKSQGSLDTGDMLGALKTLQTRSSELFGTRKTSNTE